MDFKNLKQSFGSLKRTSTILVFSNGILVALLMVSLFINFQKDTIVIHNLNESCQDSLISRSNMNEANHKRLGFYLAGMLGNITPANYEFASSAVMPFIAPDIYQEVKKLMAIQIDGLKRDEVVMTFTPTSSFVENGTTFITGSGTLTGPTGKAKKYTRTYEFDFVVENYTPLARYIEVYDDVAHDAAWEKKNSNKKKDRS